MKKQRKHYTPEEKVAILRRHLLEQVRRFTLNRTEKSSSGTAVTHLVRFESVSYLPAEECRCPADGAQC